MDKNSAIGFGLLMALLALYIVFNQSNQPKKKPDTKQKTELVQDSTQQKTAADTGTVLAATSPDTTNGNATVAIIAPQETTLENEDVSITFTNQGAYPTKVVLKKFQTSAAYENGLDKEMTLFEGAKNSFNLEYQKNGLTLQTKKQGFNSTVDAGGKKVTFTNDQGFSIAYTLPEKGYMTDMQIITGGVDKSKNITMLWDAQSLHTERLKETEKLYTQVCYNIEGEGYDYYTIRDQKNEDFEKKAINWLSFKQHYFNTTLIPTDKQIAFGEVSSNPTPEEDSATVSNFAAKLSIKPIDRLDFKLYTGPNDYQILKTYDIGLEEIVPMSYGYLAFIKYINIWLVVPLFNFLSGFWANMGIVIIVLTFIIRLLMSPFTYKSYVSSAKMKALKPELDELKEKFADDKQAFGVEQMKLYKTAGVNPLGGCLPALLQMPIFFALFSFFPHAIQLRQKSFWWATDLSSYDSIYNFPPGIDIPFYGDHISLFTILFALTSIGLALYSMNNATMDQSNPVMKYMPFIMPIMFLGIFNKFAAALTLYYFVSNLITLALQFVIQNYIIDKDKIRAKIEAKKSEPVKESKFMQKMKELQEKQAAQGQTRSQRRK